MIAHKNDLRKVSEKMIFFYENDSRFNPRRIRKSRFLIGQVPIEKYGLKLCFANQHIEIEKSFTEVLPP